MIDNCIAGSSWVRLVITLQKSFNKTYECSIDLNNISRPLP